MDTDEIIDDAINVFGIADGYLTPFDSDRIAGLQQIGVEVAEGERVTLGDGSEQRVRWFRGTAEDSKDGVRAFARILGLMNSNPNARTTAEPGDVEGHFDVWFDGGAVKHDTGISNYLFADGSTASWSTSLVWQVSIGLPDERSIRLSSAQADRSEDDIARESD